MKLEDYVPATQVRGWIRSLCEQNQPLLTGWTRKSRVLHLQQRDQLLFGPIDHSVTQGDRDNAERFYHRAFWRWTRDAVEPGRFEPAIYSQWDQHLQTAPRWILDAKRTRGQDWTGFTYDHVFEHLSEADLNVLPPRHRDHEGRGTPEHNRERATQRSEKDGLTGAILMCPRNQLPALGNLLPYSMLPDDYRPAPPIDGLGASTDRPSSALGMALMNEAKQQRGLRSDAAHFLAHGCGKWDEPRLPKKGEWPDVIESFRKAFKDSTGKERYAGQKPAHIETYFRRAMNGATRPKNTPPETR